MTSGMDKPRQVVFGLLNDTWGIGNYEAFEILGNEYENSLVADKHISRLGRRIVNVEPAEGGTFKIDGVDEFNKALYMTPYSIEATANDGYEFAGWKDGAMMLDEKSTTMSSVLYGDVTITIIFNKKDTETALDETTAGEGAAKVLRNGVLYILREGRTYDTAGRLVE